ncbi:MAG: hypothetical protein KGL42_00230 [Betaproteobacteria bacterium]|nr:hypothetical protein [Betaproteobacteria bacterium]
MSSLGHLQQLTSWLNAWITSPLWLSLITVVGIFGVVSVLLKPIVSSIRWFRNKRSAQIAAELQAKTNVQSFTDDDITDAVEDYIVPDATNVDPANEDDLRTFAFVRENIFVALDRALSSPDKTHLMILADSGMGKTTLLLNFFARELDKRKSQRREVAIVPLGRPDADAQIKAIANKRSTILLLDALDEDTLAITDYKKRLHDVMELAADFKGVMVSCRTQFFENDQAVPTSTGIARVAQKRAGSPGVHHFHRIFLAPFSEGQVSLYIERAIPFYRFKARRRARALVTRIPELTVRPMLLALLPKLLVNEQQVSEMWDLYEFMVRSWLSRESHWIVPEELLSISERVAVEAYLGRQSRHSERLRPDEISSLLQETASPVDSWKLTARSLLNRDATGNFKFAHRSIMEFLFIRALVGGEEACAKVRWTDMMCTLFLSWGRSHSGSDPAGQKRAQYLLDDDRLFATGLFPLVDACEPASHIGVEWAQRALGMAERMRERVGIPAPWKKWTSRLIQREEVVRLYELSEGIIWQFVLTRDMQEKNIYREPVGAGRCIDCERQTWERPTLTEFRSLAETLLSHEAFLLDNDELYWLADADSKTYAMARFRDTAIENTAPPMFRNGASFLTGAPLGPNGRFSLDVYSRSKVISLPPGAVGPIALVAINVATLRGDAQLEWVKDMNEPRNWALRPHDFP